MGVYWTAVSYKKDASFISGEVKSRQCFEVNIPLARKFKASKVDFRGGVQAFESIRKNAVDYMYGIYSFGEMFFYFNADDLVDGSNIRKVSSEEYYGICYSPSESLKTLKKISEKTNNFMDWDGNPLENREGLIQLIALLQEANENGYLVHFYWSE